MYNNIVEIIIVPLKNLELEIRLLNNLFKLSYESGLSEIPDSVKKKPIEDEEYAIKIRMQNIKEGIDSNIMMFIEYMPDDLLAVLEEIKYSQIMEKVSLYDDFSDMEQGYEDIKQLLCLLEQFISDHDIAYRKYILLAHNSWKTTRNSINTICEACKYLKK